MGTRIRFTTVHLRALLPARDGGRWLTACGDWAPADQCSSLATNTTCGPCQNTGAYRAQR